MKLPEGYKRETEFQLHSRGGFCVFPAAESRKQVKGVVLEGSGRRVWC